MNKPSANRGVRAFGGAVVALLLAPAILVASTETAVAVLPSAITGAALPPSVASASTQSLALLEFTTAPAPIVIVPGGGQPQPVSRVVSVPGFWEPSADTVDYQWLRNGTPIPGATMFDYFVRFEDAGAQLSVRVTAHKDGYRSTEMTSEPMQVAGEPDPEPLEEFTSAPIPVLKGTAIVGGSVSAVPGGWSPVPDVLDYAWLRDGNAIPSQIGSTYRPSAADAGHLLSVQVTASRSGYVTTTRISATVRVAPAKPVPKRLSATPKPRIAGSVRVGKRVSVRAGSWKPARVLLSYRWLRNGKAIKGATKTKYKLTRKDRGKRISVRVTGKKSGYVTVTKTSSSKRVR